MSRYCVEINGAEFECPTVQAAADRIALESERTYEPIANMFELRDYAERCGLDRLTSVWVRS